MNNFVAWLLVFNCVSDIGVQALVKAKISNSDFQGKQVSII